MTTTQAQGQLIFFYFTFQIRIKRIEMFFAYLKFLDKIVTNDRMRVSVYVANSSVDRRFHCSQFPHIKFIANYSQSTDCVRLFQMSQIQVYMQISKFVSMRSPVKQKFRCDLGQE